jgi:hypothetical protein
MTRKPISRRLVSVLLGIAAVLVVSLATLLVTGRILDKMGDAAGSAILDAVALGLGILWAIDVVCLILSLGLNASAEDDGPPQGPY